MKNLLPTRKLVLSLFVTGLLLYFMCKSASPKIVFVPFLICSISLAGKCIAQFFNKEKLAMVFHKLFIAGFLVFWFGFLAVAAFLSIRDKSYGLLIFSLSFWLVGIYLIKNKLLGKKGSKNTSSPFRFAFIVSAALVSIAILAGILLFVLGIRRGETGLLFAGTFFVLGSLTFVLAWLTVNEYFEKCKVDVLGLYMGFLLAGIGIGIIAWQFGGLGLWLLIPILMTVAGIAQIIKSLKNRK